MRYGLYPGGRAGGGRAKYSVVMKIYDAAQCSAPTTGNPSNNHTFARSRQPHIYFNCRVFFPQATSHYTDRMIGMLSAPFWKWASVREGPPVDSSTTRSENQAKLQTSGRTKTAVVQCCSAAVLQEQEPSPLSAIRPSCGQLAALFCPLLCCRS